jgi:hypothetical protein
VLGDALGFRYRGRLQNKRCVPPSIHLHRGSAQGFRAGGSAASVQSGPPRAASSSVCSHAGRRKGFISQRACIACTVCTLCTACTGAFNFASTSEYGTRLTWISAASEGKYRRYRGSSRSVDILGTPKRYACAWYLKLKAPVSLASQGLHPLQDTCTFQRV